MLHSVGDTDNPVALKLTVQILASLSELLQVHVFASVTLQHPFSIIDRVSCWACVEELALFQIGSVTSDCMKTHLEFSETSEGGIYHCDKKL